MTRLTTLTLSALLLTSTVGCSQQRWAGYRGGSCCPPQGGIYGAPMQQAPMGGGFYSPTGMGVPMHGPTAFHSTPMYGSPVYGSPVPTTAFAPIDPMPTF